MAFLIDCCFVKYHSGTPGGKNKQTNKLVSSLTFAYKPVNSLLVEARRM